MVFRMNASGNFVTFENGTKEELSFVDWSAMLRRQLMAIARK